MQDNAAEPITPAPLITVITATYNWSSVLRYAIRSVLWQTLQDFEMLVIGDGCTDDSAEVVASFHDRRLRWHNLPENSGHQSVPNNTGLAMARGKYVAYLGHDDLWHPTHLANLVNELAIGPPSEWGVKIFVDRRFERERLDTQSLDPLGPSRPLFVHTQPPPENWSSRKKAVVWPEPFQVGSGRPPFAERKCGDEGEEHRLHRRFDTQRLPSKKTARMGDKAKPLASLGRRLCCLWRPVQMVGDNSPNFTGPGPEHSFSVLIE
jgi:Glycosyl transferase family 2